MKTLYYNGTVYPGALPAVSAFAVENGRFCFAGSDADGFSLGCEERIDLRGRFVCAGFNDSHMHLLGFGMALSQADLASHSGSLQEMLAFLKEFAAAAPPGAWIRGRGWNQDYFTDVCRMPDRRDLDAVFPDRPVVLIRACGHCLVANSKALSLCGITADTVFSGSGRIGREESSEPSGLFFEDAMLLVTGRIPVPDKASVKEMLRRACRALNGFGITAVQSDDFSALRSLSRQTVIEAFRELEAEGGLTVRVYEQSNIPDLEELKRFLAEGGMTGNGSGLFRFGPLKLIADGSLGARTAYLSAPYADDPSSRGTPVFTQEALEELIGFAHAQGMQIAVHAIGDAALDQVLDAVEKAQRAFPRADCRHGVVHCQVSRPDQLRRLAALGMHIYVQSIFLDYDIRIVPRLLGPGRAASSYSWKTLSDLGCSVSNGSDAPVELPDVMAGIQCAVTRCTLKDDLGPYLPDQAFSVREAIDSYTLAGAYAAFEDPVRGRIRPGHYADFTVLSRDPFETAPFSLKDIRAEATYLAGERVF